MKTKKIIQIQEDLPDTHYFVYKKQKYPINFTLFLYSSEFFLNNQEVLQKNKLINIIDEQLEDKILNISEENVQSFIKYVHREPIEINDDNVSILNYLATKYQIKSLITFTQQYINQNQKDIIIPLLILNQNDPTADTKYYEDFISKDILYYIKDDRLLSVNFSVLYRILIQYKETPSDDIIEFYFKCLDRYGKNASILFSNVDFTQLKTDFLNRLMTQYSEKFDFHFVDESLYMRLYDCESQLILSTEETQQKLEEQEKINKNLVEKIDEMNKKIVEMQNEMNSRIEIEKKMQCELDAAKKKYDEVIDKLTCEINELKENQQKQDEQIIELPHQRDFYGIIKYLTDKTGGNIHDNNTIDVSSNLIYDRSYHPKYALDFNDNTFYESTNAGNATITFNFKEKSIQLSSYSIKTYCNSDGCGHLRNWVIECSNDGINYDIIDQHSNDSSLNGFMRVATFYVNNQSSKFYSYIRLRQTGVNWCSDASRHNYVLFYCIEFYGNLKLK